MKKIMFSDKFGLTKAVLEGRKTMTRRIIPDGKVFMFPYFPCGAYRIDKQVRRYNVGEILAVAQPYKDIIDDILKIYRYTTDAPFRKHAGWNNKMYVQGIYMPHLIQITDVHVERLKNISNEDAIREGVYLRNPDSSYKPEWIPEYTFGNGKYHAKYPKVAFAELIDEICGKGTWNKNPLMFTYTFELIR